MLQLIIQTLVAFARVALGSQKAKDMAAKDPDLVIGITDGLIQVAQAVRQVAVDAKASPPPPAS